MLIEPKPTKIKTMVLCFMVAVVIWFMNKLNQDGYRVQVKYPLRITYNDSAYTPLSTLPKEVTAQLTGNGWKLLRKSLSLGVSPVNYHLADPLRSNQLNANVLMMQMNEQIKDVRVNEVMPDTTLLAFDKLVSKNIVLKVNNAQIDPEKGFVVSSVVNLSPSNIIFTGAASAIKNLKDTIWVKIPRKKIKTNFDENLSIDYPHLVFVKANTDKVFVSFEVAELLSPQNP